MEDVRQILFTSVEYIGKVCTKTHKKVIVHLLWSRLFSFLLSVVAFLQILWGKKLHLFFSLLSSLAFYLCISLI